MADRGPDPARLATLVAEHDTWLAVERGVARNTRVAYARDLAKYAAFQIGRAHV